MKRGLLGAAVLVAALAGLVLLISTGVYGFTLFLVIPAILGAAVSWWARPKTGKVAALLGAAVILVGALALLAVGLEGAFCVLMCLPVTMPVGALSAWLAFRARERRPSARGTIMLLLIPTGSLGFDVTATPPVFEVTTTIDIAAPPEKVWPHVIAFPDIPEPADWYFRAGLAYPERTRIEGSGPGAARYCELSTGPVVETVEVWNEPRLLRFRVTASPAPMREWSPYSNVEPKHLHGYFESKRGQFLLTRLPNGGTRVEGTSWYQHGLWPAQYWRLWSDAVIHRIHQRVLDHIRRLAEAPVHQ